MTHKNWVVSDSAIEHLYQAIPERLQEVLWLVVNGGAPMVLGRLQKNEGNAVIIAASESLKEFLFKAMCQAPVKRAKSRKRCQRCGASVED